MDMSNMSDGKAAAGFSSWHVCYIYFIAHLESEPSTLPVFFLYCQRFYS